MKTGIIVIDIGMTNKKVAVYDERLKQLDVAYRNFAPVSVRDSLGNDVPAHDLDGMREWFASCIKEFASKYDIRALSVTTHGATAVFVGGDGKPCAPCVLYTYEPGKEFHDSFHALCGSGDELQRMTHSPRFDSMINLAKGIYFVRERFPKEFAAAETILNFPQYWTFLLTGKKCYEQTFLACHTYLWEQNKRAWSSVAEKLGITGKMPSDFVGPCSAAGTVLPEVAEKLGLSAGVVVASGIHDSNASLLPYLAKGGGDFVLNSTGTWCVLMHPDASGNSAVMGEDDIGKAVFFNRSALDKPVKTAIFLGGLEVDSYVKIFRRENSTDAFPCATMEDVRDVLRRKSDFVLPEIVRGSGQFPSSRAGISEGGKFFPYESILGGSAVPGILADERRFWAALVVSMVIQTETALRRVALKDGTAVFTEGGFRKNALYNTLLASVMRKNDFFITGISEATAAGSAMCALTALTGVSLSELGKNIPIEKTRIMPDDAGDYESYKQEWLRMAAEQE